MCHCDSVVAALKKHFSKHVGSGTVKDGRRMKEESDKLKEDTEPLYAGMLFGITKFQMDCAASCNIMPINLLNPDNKLETGWQDKSLY